MIEKDLSRRNFLLKSIAAGVGFVALPHLPAFPNGKMSGMKFGLVTYEWAKDWDLPTLIANCEKSGALGVELRTQHAHAVEINLSPSQREEVKKRFADSPVTCLGYGSNYEYHSPDPAKLKENIEGTKAYIKLCHDIGSTGIKVKPNTLPEGIPKEKTIAQIATSFNEVGKFAQDYGQLIRVEVHGHLTQELPVMKAIFDQVTEPNVKICWNCNPEDLLPPGLEANFHSVKKWFGDTVHVREFNIGDYPYPELFRLFGGMNYEGWILMEARSQPTDRVAALKEQLELFNALVAQSKG
ncbi:MAG: sugar phosphate isomerase/epimerase family protein [Algoriphagus sp.]|uniref:sugar phosphate isomerase/epimerase family protein n=1 Tax=Algoriphagus sp. TaxID=1872435 RepID=UPI00272F94C1|nr:sugar phosphate isomerase/epimerase family protein [Algoriphagus sp.]MDP2041322.1 sugar phosphate isomerase/epimerase family protein [Algoriphagus sp.]MDP3470379.1 sugar phosphate isomerase/epimerase family protein [Algoriphagus sp.]